MEKATFPGRWTNSTCSHPLWALPPPAVSGEELEDDGNAIGVKRAARRKLQHELSIDPAQVPLESFVYLTRLHYKAPCSEVWGEHEIDYCLIVQKDVAVTPVPGEVMDVMWVNKDELRELFATADAKGLLITPWFRLIAENFLYKWWDNLSGLEAFRDETIHRLGDGV
eukprot:c11744_g1_i2.p1 GENE.c11744_g1_i2~~c11744_g1_i2.p1  ORF type:complete len:168 (-),score=34.55 c11744_g1_i2:614-1117(-)